MPQPQAPFQPQPQQTLVEIAESDRTFRTRALAFGEHVKGLVVYVFYSLVGAAALATGYVGLRAIWWAACFITESLGV